MIIYKHIYGALRINLTDFENQNQQVKIYMFMYSICFIWEEELWLKVQNQVHPSLHCQFCDITKCTACPIFRHILTFEWIMSMSIELVKIACWGEKLKRGICFLHRVISLEYVMWGSVTLVVLIRLTEKRAMIVSQILKIRPHFP